MTESAKAGTTWRRWTVEVVAIVGSILLAFAIDAWWDDLQLRQSENAALEQLRDEFRINLGVIQAAQESHRQAQMAFVDVLRVIRERGDPADSYVIPDSLLFQLGSWNTVDPAQGVLASLTSSGRILLIEDTDLRAQLTSWSRDLEDVREEEVEDRRVTADQVIPFINQYVPLVSMEHRVGEDSAFPAPSAFSGNYRGLLSSLVFENLIHGRLVRKLNILGEYSTLLARHDSILAKLEAQLGQAS